MIDIVILCPISIEYNAVRKYLTKPTFKEEIQFGLSYEEGIVDIGEGSWNIALFETGGKVGNLQTRTTQVLHSLKPAYIFLVGIAAGIKDVGLGDVIVGTKAYGYESGKETSDGFLARPDVIYSSRKLIELAKQIVREQPPKNYKVEFGAIAGGNRVINTANNSLRIIKKSYNDTKALEMESIGFAFAAQEAQVQFLNIRSICDLAVHKNDDYQSLAAERAAEFTIHLINRLPKLEKLAPIQNISVYCLNQPFQILSWRSLKPIELKLSKNKLQFHANGQVISATKIKSCDRFKMNGDFSKNWVRVEMLDNQIFYFSEKSFFVGLGNIFGGNRGLFKKLKPFAINT